MSATKIAQIAASLDLQINSGNAVLLLGLPGTGKTAVAQQWLKMNADVLIVIDGTQTPEELVQGVPFVMPSTEELSRDLMAQMKKVKESLKDSKKTVGLDIEEMSSFTSGDMRALMNMILSGTLPDGTVVDRSRLKVIATANPSAFMDDNSDANVNDIETAILTRMAVYNVEADVESWLNYARENSVHRSVIWALTSDGSKFHDNENRTTPRTLEFLSNMLKKAEELEITPEKQDFEALVGVENAEWFRNFYVNREKLIRLQDVFESGDALKEFLELGDAEQSYIFTNGVKDIAKKYDKVAADILTNLPIETQVQVVGLLPDWANEKSELAKQAFGAKNSLENI